MFRKSILLLSSGEQEENLRWLGSILTAGQTKYPYIYFRKLDLFLPLGVREENLLGLFQIKENNKIPLINSEQSPVHADKNVY